MTENITFTIGSIPCKRLLIYIGVGPGGQLVGPNHFAGDNVKITVVPGKWAYVERTNPSTDQVTIFEFALGPLGWEYERMVTS